MFKRILKNLLKPIWKKEEEKVNYWIHRANVSNDEETMRIAWRHTTRFFRRWGRIL